MAKTTVSRDISDISLLFDALGNFFQLGFLVYSNNDVFTLNKRHFSNLRDFTRTSRTGEVAQGITYLLAQEYLRFNSVVDFEGYINSRGGIIPAKSSTPDFIMQNHNLNFNVGLIESKGSYPEKSDPVKSSLKKALKQCHSGQNLLTNFDPRYTITNKYGVHIKFEDELSSQSSVGYLADPQSLPVRDERNLSIIRYHYASWFMLMGDQDNAFRLATNEPLKIDDAFFRNKNEYYYYGRRSNSVFPIFDIFWTGFQIAIPRAIIELLMGDILEAPSYDSIDTLQVIQYIDGVRLIKLQF
ncbi:hypothetical protein [Ohtaekwangia koreensis]|nr:hypothetical protein [Ohtaekwangia koreensis]